ncbi:MAG: LysR family transcriptional regulator, partial [Lachnospiraceae bacterium]|nr:LysR family transcriptional regulator [Lachnospiraceae bacterium]
MEIKHLRTLIAIVDYGSYQKAAEALGYTQSTITIQMQQLEAELRIPLFQRIGRRMSLSQAGEKVVEQARELVDIADQIGGIADASQPLTGTLRVDIVETLLCFQMQEVIREFRARAPLVKLILRNRNCLKISENLKEGSCDLGISYRMDWNREVLQTEYLKQQAECILVASSELTDTDFVTPHQVKSIPLISDEPDSLFRRQFESYLQEQDIQLEETIELWSTEAIKRCVMSNLGITFLPRFAVEEELADGRLVELSAPVSGIRNPVL